MPLLVLVAGRESHRQRRAACVYGQVVTAAGPAAERARDLLAPFFASTSEASTITRDQSSLSAPASCCCKRRSAASSTPDRKSTRLNSSHANISYAVFCLKK